MGSHGARNWSCLMLVSLAAEAQPPPGPVSLGRPLASPSLCNDSVVMGARDLRQLMYLRQVWNTCWGSAGCCRHQWWHLGGRCTQAVLVRGGRASLSTWRDAPGRTCLLFTLHIAQAVCRPLVLWEGYRAVLPLCPSMLTTRVLLGGGGGMHVAHLVMVLCTPASPGMWILHEIATPVCASHRHLFLT